MKQHRLTIVLSAIALLLGIVAVSRGSLLAQAQPSPGSHEYLTIRWAGREHTHVIRPGGEVEFIGAELRKLPRPERADERSFFLNAAMNGLVKEGWEFAGMTSDEIVMQRSLVR